MSATTTARVEKSACIQCSRNCGLEITVENGRFTRIRGDDDP